MKNVKQLAVDLKEAGHPGYRVVEAALAVSNDPGFLAGMARLFLEAASLDLDEMKRSEVSLGAALRAEVKS